MTKKPRQPIDPLKYASSGTEDAAQIALFMWASTPEIKIEFPELRWLFAIPNGGFRTKAGAARLRAMGVKRGVSDTLLPVRRGVYSGLFLELKKPKQAGKAQGRVQDEQSEWIDFFRTQGFGACVCYGFEEARDMIISYLKYEGK